MNAIEVSRRVQVANIQWQNNQIKKECSDKYSKVVRGKIIKIKCSRFGRKHDKSRESVVIGIKR